MNLLLETLGMDAIQLKLGQQNEKVFLSMFFNV